MLGWINSMLKAFVIDNYGEDTWRLVLAKSGVADDNWVSTCPYADSATYK